MQLIRILSVHLLFAFQLVCCTRFWQQLQPPLRVKYQVVAQMSSYRNKENMDYHHKLCDAYVYNSDSYKCDVRFSLVVLNGESGESSEGTYPIAEKNYGDDYYWNADSINQDTFENSGTFASVLANDNPQNSIWVELLIGDKDIFVFESVAEIESRIPFAQLSMQPKLFQVVNTEYVNATVSLHLQCAPGTCNATQCYQPDSWRVCDQNQLTCMHWPLVAECQRLAGNFMLRLNVHEVALRQLERDLPHCDSELTMCMAGETEECKSADYRAIYRRWNMGNRNDPMMNSSVYDYARFSKRIERTLKMHFKLLSKCPSSSSATELLVGDYSYNIARSLTNTLQSLFLKLGYNDAVELEGSLATGCAKDFTGPDCLQRLV